MRLTFYTNTMALIESENNRILTDPWVTFDNFSLSGFYNFPKCNMSKEEVARIRPDYIYISHTHPDHCDPITLQLFNKETPILISHYENNFTERNLRRWGFSNIIVVKDGLKLKGGDYCWIEASNNAPELDSVALFKMDGLTLVNFNDNSFSKEQCEGILKRFEKIDIGLIPSAAHGPWPMFYDNLSDSEKAEQAKLRAQNQKERFVDFIKVLRPRWVVPFSGGVISGADKAKRYAYSGINRRSDVVKYALEEVDFTPIFMSEGNVYDFKTQTRFGEYKETDFDTEHEYVESLSRIPSKFSPNGLFYVDPSERVDLTQIIKTALGKVVRWQENLGKIPNSVCYLDVGERDLYRISMKENIVERIQEHQITDTCYEIFRMPYECLLALLTRHYFWSNITPHITHFRKGDYDPNLMLMLNFLSV